MPALNQNCVTYALAVEIQINTIFISGYPSTQNQ